MNQLTANSETSTSQTEHARPTPAPHRRDGLGTAIALVVLTLAFFAPAQIFLTNAGQFFFNRWHLVTLLTPVNLLLIGLLILCARPLRGSSARSRTAAVLLTAGLLLWAQGNLLTSHTAPLDGRPIDWSAYRLRAWIDAAIWLAALLSAGLFGHRLGGSLIRRICIAFIAIQLITVGTQFIRGRNASQPRYYPDRRQQFVFSPQQNVIVLLLDMFQSDVFNEIVEEHPEYRQVFEGFTYFRNCTGGFASTVPSVSLILTGQRYDNSEPFAEFRHRAFTSHSSLPARLQQAGYRTDLISFVTTVEYIPEVASNAQPTTFANGVTLAADTWLMAASAYRFAPTLLKQPIHDRWLTAVEGREPSRSGDLAFAARIRREFSLTSDRPTFKFFHLWGNHAPYTLSSDMKVTAPQWDREGCKATARGTLEITRNFLQVLRENGIYDSSTIVVLADHGNPWVWPRIGVRPPQDMSLEPALYNVKEYVIASALPLMLIKPAGATGPMTTSDAPVFNGDVPRTIADLIGLDGDFPGESMFRIPEDASRTRTFRHYRLNREPTLVIPKMWEYEINGFAWSPAAWKPTWRTFDSQIAYEPPPVYQPGEPIRFTPDGNAAAFQGDGWCDPEEGFTWTEGTHAHLFLPLPEDTRDDLMLEADIANLLVAHPGEAQIVNVSANNRPIGQWRVIGTQRYRMAIPRSLLTHPTLKISFELPNATTAREVGIGDDQRLLAVAFSSITVNPIASNPILPRYELGQAIQFGTDGSAAAFQGGGWAQPEDGFTWTEGDQAVLYLPMAPTTDELQLTVNLRNFINSRSGGPQQILVFAGDQQIARWVVSAPGEYRATIPADPKGLQFLRLTFKMPDAISPRELYGTDDPRVLSAAFQSLILAPSH